MNRPAICLGGPCHGLLTRIDQDVGLLAVPIPRRSPDEPARDAGYRVTGERVRYHGHAEPYVVLHWTDEDRLGAACPGVPREPGAALADRHREH
ncbi:hypothetical protein [Streptosporangium pseudovulgare]|uniref:Nitrile hydratase beta subunit domain-containing protein n=1 Tax=Streptosporangium pseudovulgare TaxID=35765 RepID=A0ABQ2RAL2_9ACTN|nr:hypothetical protein [Streptosporangium pseudovulgare]GGQ19390.1 hypothetical protein GCM10010140_57120 [Streptosporangium pseudovulgare]